ncbi:hypothetical protein KR009_007387, partial [Drosophila setifemur]
VFCSGPLLDAVQRSNMFPDSKTFVDMSCIYPPGQTLEDFEMFSNCRRNDGSMKFLQMFVEKHFNEPGSELEPWTPPDWKERPPFLAKICDPKLKEFGSKVNKLWKDLGRRVKEDVKENPDHYSLIYLPKPFIVPNANSREYRYWDSFWIVRGLLHSGMYQTARGMIDNYLALVRQYGFVPGCGRIYCAGRSNPPLLIMMVKAYVEVTKDDGYATHALPLLEIEFETFVKNHAVQVKGRTMYQYRDSSQGPRPEAYMDDLESVEHIESQEEKQALYTELKSACESGMEFSSRWFVALDGSNRGTISDTKTSAIVPVELNAIVFRSGKILSEFHRKFGNSKKAEDYQDRACGLVKSIRDVFWNDDAGIWLDYDLVNEQPRNYFCCTNFSPLWARAFPLADTDKVSQGVMKYIETNKLDDMYGGVPNTLNKQAGQKWDYPNAFPPMMFMIIEGLFNLGTPESKEMSKKWAHRWVKSNYTAYKYEDFMFEKYYCKDFGTAGSVDSKRIPLGYGWTNGVAIELLSKHGKDISMDDNKDEATNSKRGLEENDTAKQGKEEYIITSEANMEETSSSPANKKSTSAAPSCCASTVHGFQEQQPQRAGAKKTQAPQAGGCACGSPEQKNQTQAPQGGGGGTFGASQQQMQTQAPQGGGCGICGAPPQQKQTQAQTQGGGGGTGGASQQQMQTQASQGGGCVISGPLPPPPPRQQTQQTDPQGCECSDSSPQTKPQPQSCPEDCGPDERELQKIEQMKKMQDCKEKQIQELKERQAQIQKQQEGAQSSDCKESKDEKQDCTASLKTGQKAGCACSGQEEEDEDEKFQRQQEERTGQYSPLADPVDKKESRGNQQVKSSPGDCSCSNATGAAPEKQMSSPEPCPLCSKCPNCGSTYGQGQTKTVGTNRPSIPSENDDKDCGCENKSGAGSTPAQPGKPTLCGPCGIHLTKDFPTDKGPAPQYNKQFPLRD